jgi:hypothetical protein
MFNTFQMEIIRDAEYIAVVVLTSFAILVNYPVIQLDTHARIQFTCRRSAYVEADSGL